MDPRACVEKKAVYPVGLWEVWAALTKPEELSRWFGADVVSLDLRPAGRIVFREKDGSSRRALIETVEAPRRFAFRWLPAPVRIAAGPGGFAAMREPGTRVEFVLEEAPGGTALTVVETPSIALGERLTTGPSRPITIGFAPPDPLGAPPRIMALA